MPYESAPIASEVLGEIAKRFKLEHANGPSLDKIRSIGPYQRQDQIRYEDFDDNGALLRSINPPQIDHAIDDSYEEQLNLHGESYGIDSMFFKPVAIPVDLLGYLKDYIASVTLEYRRKDISPSTPLEHFLHNSGGLPLSIDATLVPTGFCRDIAYAVIMHCLVMKLTKNTAEDKDELHKLEAVSQVLLAERMSACSVNDIQLRVDSSATKALDDFKNEVRSGFFGYITSLIRKNPRTAATINNEIRAVLYTTLVNNLLDDFESKLKGYISLTEPAAIIIRKQREFVATRKVERFFSRRDVSDLLSRISIELEAGNKLSDQQIIEFEMLFESPLMRPLAEFELNDDASVEYIPAASVSDVDAGFSDNSSDNSSSSDNLNDNITSSDNSQLVSDKLIYDESDAASISYKQHSRATYELSDDLSDGYLSDISDDLQLASDEFSDNENKNRMPMSSNFKPVDKDIKPESIEYEISKQTAGNEALLQQNLDSEYIFVKMANAFMQCYKDRNIHGKDKPEAFANQMLVTIANLSGKDQIPESDKLKTLLLQGYLDVAVSVDSEVEKEMKGIDPTTSKGMATRIEVINKLDHGNILQQIRDMMLALFNLISSVLTGKEQIKNHYIPVVLREDGPPSSALNQASSKLIKEARRHHDNAPVRGL